MSQQGNRKTKNLLDFNSLHNKKSKVFFRTYAQCQLFGLARLDLANRGVCQAVQPHIFRAPSARFRWWGPGAQAWWEAPGADTKCLGRG